VSLSKQLFLRINTSPVYLPAFQLLADENDFIEHNSYVELTGLARNYRDDIARAVSLGRLTARVAIELEAAVRRAKTLTQDDKDLIRECLFGPDGPANGHLPKAE
jgi:hypothetical protein